MNFEDLRPAPPKLPTEDARDLLARLYREIGISAVAAALQVPVPRPDADRPKVRDLPGVLRGNDIAA